MIRFVKDLLLGEPVFFTGIVSTALTAWMGALVASGELVPLWLAIATPIWVALGAWYARSVSTPNVSVETVAATPPPPVGPTP
jgi:hypothetical protein